MAGRVAATINSAFSPLSKGSLDCTWQNSGCPSESASLCRIQLRSSPACFSVSPGKHSSRSVRPISASSDGTPNRASHSRVSVATKVKKFTTISAVPMKWSSRSFWFCVATPVAQLLRWQIRKYLHPRATMGAVPKPKLSAPRMAALITSRPVFRPPSACRRMAPRRWLPRRVCCTSARPSSNGEPA